MANDGGSTWRPAKVLENRLVANGSMWIGLEATDELPAAFEPGHVLGLGLKQGDSLIRHAYTVSRGDPPTRRFEHHVDPPAAEIEKLAGRFHGLA